jgi:hypothetical protein
MRPYRYRPLAYFALAYLISWVPWAIAASAGAASAALAQLLGLAGLLGPTAATLLLIATSGDRALASDFRDRLLDLGRIRLPWLIVISR